MNKKYVDIIIKVSTSGKVTPMAILWDDGRKYDIDKVIDVRYSASQTGEGGIRYKCLVQGKEVFVFEEQGKKRLWFIETDQH
ncbi:MAG: hypothetical protein WCY05_06980 [Candidatus Omnitrophota bacterium]